MLRRTKAQVAPELPPRTEDEIVVDLEGPQRRLYDAELKRARAQLLGAFGDPGHAFPVIALGRELVRRGHDVCIETWDKWRENAMDVNSTMADPMFVDPQKGDFTPKRGSPVAGRG